MAESRATFEGFCILELMGHRRLGGYVREEEIAGHGFLRIDVPAIGERAAMTQYVSPSSVYALTPCTEAMARTAAEYSHVEPVSQWELRQLAAPRTEVRDLDAEPEVDDYLDL